MSALIQLFAAYSDATILISGALMTVALALLVAFGAHRLWFAQRLDALEEHNKLAEVVHGSLLAFTVFVLALVLSDVRSNLGRADDAVSREGSIIARLDRDLGTLDGEEANRARSSLRDYIRTVINDEWPALALQDATLAASAGRALTAFILDARRVAHAHPDAAVSLRGLVEKLEEHRQGRLEAATKSVPSVFWWIITAFLIGAMILNGRHKLNRMTLSLIAIHMAAIGMVLALIIVMDEPFRGQTSISTTPLSKAVAEAGPAPVK